MELIVALKHSFRCRNFSLFMATFDRKFNILSLFHMRSHLKLPTIYFAPIKNIEVRIFIIYDLRFLLVFFTFYSTSHLRATVFPISRHEKYHENICQNDTERFKNKYSSFYIIFEIILLILSSHFSDNLRFSSVKLKIYI